MKFIAIAITSVALIVPASAFAGAHTQVNENAAEAAANNGTIMGAYLRNKDSALPPNTAASLNGGWGNVGSAAASTLDDSYAGGQVSNPKGGSKGKKGFK